MNTTYTGYSINFFISEHPMVMSFSLILITFFLLFLIVLCHYVVFIYTKKETKKDENIKDIEIEMVDISNHYNYIIFKEDEKI